MKIRAQVLDGDAAENFWIATQPQQGLVDHGTRTVEIAAAEVMKSAGHLDQRLQESLLGLGSLQPNRLPMLMRFEELFRSIAAQPFVEIALRPVEHQG